MIHAESSNDYDHLMLRVMTVAVVVALSGCECGFMPVDELVDGGTGGGGRDVGGGGGASATGGGGGSSAGPSAVRLTARLPVGLHEAAAVAFDQDIWVFGGMTQAGTFVDSIYRFDTRTETIHATTFRLPSGRHAMAGARVGAFIYLFGGRASTLLSDILRFDPTTGQVTLMRSRFPTGRYNLAAAPMGASVFLFGGFDFTYLGQIHRFDPSSDTLTLLPSQLSPGRESPVAVPFSSEIYLLGGYRDGSPLAEVVRFHSPTGQVSGTATTLPVAAWQPAPLLIDGLGYLYSGESVQSVTRYDPGRLRAELVPGVETPTPQMGRGAAAVPGRGYVFGGSFPDGTVLDTIVRFTP